MASATVGRDAVRLDVCRRHGGAALRALQVWRSLHALGLSGSPALQGDYGSHDAFLFGPVLDLQALHATEVLHIVRDDDGSHGARMCRNHEISSAELRTSFF